MDIKIVPAEVNFCRPVPATLPRVTPSLPHRSQRTSITYLVSGLLTVGMQIVLADELCKDPSQFRSKCVRVLGKVESIDPRENTAKLSTGGVVIDLVMAGSVKVRLPTPPQRTPPCSHPRHATLAGWIAIPVYWHRVAELE